MDADKLVATPILFIGLNGKTCDMPYLEGNKNKSYGVHRHLLISVY